MRLRVAAASRCIVRFVLSIFWGAAMAAPAAPMPTALHRASGSGGGTLARLCILAFFTAHLSKAVVSGKSPFFYSGSPEAVVIAHI